MMLRRHPASRRAPDLLITPADKVRLKLPRTEQPPEMRSTEALFSCKHSTQSSITRLSHSEASPSEGELLVRSLRSSWPGAGPHPCGSVSKSPTPGGPPPSTTIREVNGTLDKGQQGHTASFCREGKGGQRSTPITPILGSNPCWTLLDTILNRLCTDMMNTATVF